MPKRRDTLRFAIFVVYLLSLVVVAWINRDVSDREVELVIEEQSKHIQSKTLAPTLPAEAGDESAAGQKQGTSYSPRRAQVGGAETLGQAVSLIREHAEWAAREAVALRRQSRANRSDINDSLSLQADILRELVTALERQAAQMQRLIDQPVALEPAVADTPVPAPARLEQKPADGPETVAELLMRYASQLRQAGGSEQAARLEQRANQVLADNTPGLGSSGGAELP